MTAPGGAGVSAARIYRHATGAAGAFVNAYLVETGDGIVAVDGTLTVSDGRALRARFESLGEPLLAVLVTHAHPDHYGGIVELVAGDDVPVVATAGVDAVIRRDDALKEEILRPMFGEEWPRHRAFPTRTVADGERVEFGDVSFTVLDLGPGESPHDSIWFLGDDRATVFLGDQVYHGKHAYLADGFFEDWLRHLERLRRELPADATLHIGHGGPVTPAQLEVQREYVESFVDAVRNADWSAPDEARAAVIERMTGLLPTDELRFLTELSIEPVAERLGLLHSV
ncbi:MAG TPA: MBL fold metallo-hydrolase [Gaiella sp.]|nr:MBL fold metallo-hydrolase [Gaiella sp.]